MAKAFLKPKGNFMLLLSGETLHSHRPSVVTVDSYVQSRIASGEIENLGEAPANAQDKDFGKFWEASDRDDSLAMSSYLSTLSKTPEGETPNPDGTSTKPQEQAVATSTSPATTKPQSPQSPEEGSKEVNKGTSTTSTFNKKG